MTNWITGLVWSLTAALSFFRPRLFDSFWERLERLAGQISRYKVWNCVGAGLLVLLIRAVLLPVWPIPPPYIYDEFGYLLQADTFASGRLTNPPHPLWTFFESIYILQQPSYNAKYPPGQGLVMALGQVLLGNPWFGVWLSCGVLAGVLCWALQQWLPGRWALLGWLFSLRVCLFSYWMDGYWGGALAGIGGALVFGSLGRLVRRRGGGYAVTSMGFVLGAGMFLLSQSRPFEGSLLSVIAIVVAWRRRGGDWRFWLPVIVCLAVTLGFTALYNYRVTGDALRLPYLEYERQYAAVRQFTFLPPEPQKTYRHTDLQREHELWERQQWSDSRSWRLFPARLENWRTVAMTLGGGAAPVLVLLAFIPAVSRDRRTRLTLLLVAVIVAASLVEIMFYTHYAAPFMAAFLLLVVQAFRHLRHWHGFGAGSGLNLSRTIPVVLTLLLFTKEGTRIFKQQSIDETLPVNARRGRIEALDLPPGGRHLIFVRYTGSQLPHEEWIYNLANIDGARVVWAQDEGAEQNRRLLKYFPDREAWLLMPDANPDELKKYDPLREP